MLNSLMKLVIALVALWIEAEDEATTESIYYVYPDDVDDNDLVPDSRLAEGSHIEVVVRVVPDDEEYLELFARHLARQGATDDGSRPTD